MNGLQHTREYVLIKWQKKLPLQKNIYMKELLLYDYEKVRNDYEDSLEVITPPNNDGSRPRCAFPIKHQVLRCGKWIPTEDMYYRAMLLYAYLYEEEMLKACEGKGLQWHDNIKGEQ
jgi:hypothetical protein